MSVSSTCLMTLLANNCAILHSSCFCTSMWRDRRHVCIRCMKSMSYACSAWSITGLRSHSLINFMSYLEWEAFYFLLDSWLDLRRSLISSREVCIWACFPSILRSCACKSCKVLTTTTAGLVMLLLLLLPVDPEAIRIHEQQTLWTLTSDVIYDRVTWFHDALHQTYNRQCQRVKTAPK